MSSFLCGGCLLFACFVLLFRTSPNHVLRVMQTERKVIFSCYCWRYIFLDKDPPGTQVDANNVDFVIAVCFYFVVIFCFFPLREDLAMYPG